MVKPIIIITGGDGFIGRSIITSFYKNYNFIVLKRKGSAIHYPEIQIFAKFYYDLLSLKTLNIDYSKVVGLIILAASRPNELPEKMTKDIPAFETEQARKIFNFCAEKKIKHVLFASSKSVYGKKDVLPFKEDTSIHPDTLYGMNKLLIENMGLNLAEKYNFKFTALRLAQVFGFGDRYINMPHVFMQNAILNKPLEIWNGTENDKRSYVYIKDVANAFIHFLENGHEGIFNIGQGKCDSPDEFANIILNNTPTQSKIIYNKMFQATIKQEELSVVKAKNCANWICKWGIQQAIVDFWNDSVKLQP